MRLLLIAPDSDLPKQSAEVAAIANLAGMDVYQMQGTVTRQALRRQMQGSDYEILWIAGHGTAQYIALSKGETMDYPTLSGLVRASKIRFVYLNTCSGVEIAQDIAQESGADVVCMVDEVPDLAAYEWAQDFGNQLAMGKSFRQAYDEVRRVAGRNYKYVVGGEVDSTPNPSQRDSKAPVINGGLDIQGRLRMLEQLVYGDDRLGLKSISAQFAYVIGKIAQLEPTMDRVIQENTLLREEIMSLKATIRTLHQERITLEGKMSDLSRSLAEHNIAMAKTNPWWMEYAAPLISFLVLMLMIYIAIYIMRMPI